MTNAQHLAEQKQLICDTTTSYGETLAQLEKKYSNLQDQLFCTMYRSQIELAKAKGKLALAQKNHVLRLSIFTSAVKVLLPFDRRL